MENLKTNISALARAFVLKHGVAANAVLINRVNLGSIWEQTEHNNGDVKLYGLRLFLSDSIDPGNIKLALI